MPWKRYFTSYEETMCFSHRERLGTNILQPLLSHRCDQTSREKPLGDTRVYLTHSFNSPPRKARSRRLVNPIALAGRKQRADRKSSTPPARLQLLKQRQQPRTKRRNTGACVVRHLGQALEETRTKGNQDTLFGMRILIFFSRKKQKIYSSYFYHTCKTPFCELGDFSKCESDPVGGRRTECGLHSEGGSDKHNPEKKNREIEVVNAECYRVHPAHH